MFDLKMIVHNSFAPIDGHGDRSFLLPPELKSIMITKDELFEIVSELLSIIENKKVTYFSKAIDIVCSTYRFNDKYLSMVMEIMQEDPTIEAEILEDILYQLEYVDKPFLVSHSDYIKKLRFVCENDSELIRLWTSVAIRLETEKNDMS